MERLKTSQLVRLSSAAYRVALTCLPDTPSSSAWDPVAPKKPASPFELATDVTPPNQEEVSRVNSREDNVAKPSTAGVSPAASLASAFPVRAPPTADLPGNNQKSADYVAIYWEMGKALRQKCVEINADLNDGRRMPSPEVHIQLDSLFHEAQLRGRKTDDALRDVDARLRDLGGKADDLSDRTEHVNGRTEYLSGVSAHTDKALDALTNHVKQLASNVIKHDQIVQAILASQATLQHEMDCVKQDFTVLERVCDDLAVEFQKRNSSDDEATLKAMSLAKRPAMQTQPVPGHHVSKAVETELKAMQTALTSCEQRLEYLGRSSVTMSTRIASVEHKNGDRPPSSSFPIARLETANNDTNNDIFAKKSQIVKEISDKITEGVKLIADLEEAASIARQEHDLTNVNTVQGRDHDGTTYFQGAPFVGHGFGPASAPSFAMNSKPAFWQPSQGISKFR